MVSSQHHPPSSQVGGRATEYSRGTSGAQAKEILGALAGATGADLHLIGIVHKSYAKPGAYAMSGYSKEADEGAGRVLGLALMLAEFGGSAMIAVIMINLHLVRSFGREYPVVFVSRQHVASFWCHVAALDCAVHLAAICEARLHSASVIAFPKAVA